MLALIKLNTIVSQVSSGNSFDLPNGDTVSPAYDGWDNGDYRLATILPADTVPVGMRIVSVTVEMVEDQPQYVNVLEDAPVERPTVAKSEVQARIIVAGKMTEAYAALTSNPVYFARWFAPDHPVVYCDDPDAILLVAAIGLDPDVILAEIPTP